MNNAILLLHGTSSTGKTSIARTLQTIFPGALIYLSLDLWVRQCLSERFYEPATRLEDIKHDADVKLGTHFLLPNTLENPTPWPMVASGQVTDDVIAMMYQTAVNFYQQGYWVVLDHVFVSAIWRDDFLKMTENCRRVLIKTTAANTLLAEREQARGDRMPKVYLALLENIHKDINYDAIIDTSHIDALQAAKSILDLPKMKQFMYNS